jgi:cytochrome c oxidase subunit 3
LTILLAVIFTGFQVFEYTTANFNITDGIYGSTFYMATGFHGFHVFIGTVALTVTLIRLVMNHYSTEHHFGFEAAAFYWHFVDVVWLFLYVAVYF